MDNKLWLVKTIKESQIIVWEGFIKKAPYMFVHNIAYAIGVLAAHKSDKILSSS